MHLAHDRYARFDDFSIRLRYVFTLAHGINGEKSPVIGNGYGPRNESGSYHGPIFKMGRSTS
jgi:hypothetical protein